jgi:leucyl aminopeptidase (aminopeptidase T)/predicted transcriptional regulator
MPKNLMLLQKQSQLRELGSDHNHAILNELIRSPLTCQQLSNVFSMPKQKVHYKLGKLLEEGLIEVAQDFNNNQKEVYYRAKAMNYVLAYSFGLNISDNIPNGREILTNILEQQYKISLQDIAARILDESLCLKGRDRLMIVTGKYNLPLVEKMLIEAGRRSIFCTVVYQDTELLRAKYEEYSLAAFNEDYVNFTKQLAFQTVYLNLNGESRYLQLTDPKKVELRHKHFAKSMQIIQKLGIRVAVMPGLMHDTLSENTINSELQFWQALDIDYRQLRDKTESLCRTFEEQQQVEVCNAGNCFSFEISRIMADTGSFNDSKYQIHTINLPGGEILLLPKPSSLNGVISGSAAFIGGEKVMKPVLVIADNQVVSVRAESNGNLIHKAISQGGVDGKKVALICLGTNENVKLESIDESYRQKSLGLMTIYWGENVSLGGTVNGASEWFVQIENPTFNNK